MKHCTEVGRFVGHQGARRRQPPAGCRCSPTSPDGKRDTRMPHHLARGSKSSFPKPSLQDWQNTRALARIKRIDSCFQH